MSPLGSVRENYDINFTYVRYVPQVIAYSEIYSARMKVEDRAAELQAALASKFYINFMFSLLLVPPVSYQHCEYDGTFGPSSDS